MTGYSLNSYLEQSYVKHVNRFFFGINTKIQIELQRE